MASRTWKSIGLGAVILAAVAVLGLASAQAASNRRVRVASHISIAGERLRFHGRVTSPNNGCEGSRLVKLHRSNGDVLGKTHTDYHGYWSIRAQGSAGISMGHFYATVSRRAQGTAGTIYVCKRATSRTIPYNRGHHPPHPGL